MADYITSTDFGRAEKARGLENSRNAREHRTGGMNHGRNQIEALPVLQANAEGTVSCIRVLRGLGGGAVQATVSAGTPSGAAWCGNNGTGR